MSEYHLSFQESLERIVALEAELSALKARNAELERDMVTLLSTYCCCFEDDCGCPSSEIAAKLPPEVFGELSQNAVKCCHVRELEAKLAAAKKQVVEYRTRSVAQSLMISDQQTELASLRTENSRLAEALEEILGDFHPTAHIKARELLAARKDKT